jgi:hypothetical protein
MEEYDVSVNRYTINPWARSIACSSICPCGSQASVAALLRNFCRLVQRIYGSFHETTKVVNSLRISTAGITMKA